MRWKQSAKRGFRTSLFWRKRRWKAVGEIVRLGICFLGVKAGKDTSENKRQLLLTTEVLNSPNMKHLFPQVMSVKMLTNGKWLYKVKDWFRKYDTPEECFTDHAQFFFKNKRYAKALEVKADPYRFAEEVAKAGYATAPDYASSLKKLIKMIESYE